jgi:hypothetical protein
MSDVAREIQSVYDRVSGVRRTPAMPAETAVAASR